MFSWRDITLCSLCVFADRTTSPIHRHVELKLMVKTRIEIAKISTVSLPDFQCSNSNRVIGTVQACRSPYIALACKTFLITQVRSRSFALWGPTIASFLQRRSKTLCGQILFSMCLVALANWLIFRFISSKSIGGVFEIELKRVRDLNHESSWILHLSWTWSLSSWEASSIIISSQSSIEKIRKLLLTSLDAVSKNLSRSNCMLNPWSRRVSNQTTCASDSAYIWICPAEQWKRILLCRTLLWGHAFSKWTLSMCPYVANTIRNPNHISLDI